MSVALRLALGSVRSSVAAAPSLLVPVLPATACAAPPALLRCIAPGGHRGFATKAEMEKERREMEQSFMKEMKDVEKDIPHTEQWEKIVVDNAVVNMKGDELAQVINQAVVDTLIKPFVDIDIWDYDLGVQNRDNVDDEVTVEAAYATQDCGVAVKCPTMTVDAVRVNQLNLKRVWPSADQTLRNILNGITFSIPIVSPALNKIPAVTPGFAGPIAVAQHAVADQTMAGFAQSCFRMAGLSRTSVYLCTTDAEAYDRMFQQIYDEQFREWFEAHNCEYRMVDEEELKRLKRAGNFVWACKVNDLASQDRSIAAYANQRLLFNSLLTPDGSVFMAQPAHSTLSTDYQRYLHADRQGLDANPLPMIASWANALNYRGHLDSNVHLQFFAQSMYATCLRLIEKAVMPKAVCGAIYGDTRRPGSELTDVFLEAVRQDLALAVYRYQFRIRMKEGMEWAATKTNTALPGLEHLSNPAAAHQGVPVNVDPVVTKRMREQGPSGVQEFTPAGQEPLYEPAQQADIPPQTKQGDKSAAPSLSTKDFLKSTGPARPTKSGQGTRRRGFTADRGRPETASSSTPTTTPEEEPVYERKVGPDGDDYLSEEEPLVVDPEHFNPRG